MKLKFQQRSSAKINDQTGIANIAILAGILVVGTLLFASSIAVQNVQEIQRQAAHPQMAGYCREKDDGSFWDPINCCCRDPNLDPNDELACQRFTDFGNYEFNPNAWCACCIAALGADASECSHCTSDEAQQGVIDADNTPTSQCPDPMPTPQGGVYPYLNMIEMCTGAQCSNQLAINKGEGLKLKFEYQNVSHVKVCSQKTDEMAKVKCHRQNFAWSSNNRSQEEIAINTDLEAGTYHILAAGYTNNHQYSCSNRVWYTGYNPVRESGFAGEPTPLYCPLGNLGGCRNDRFTLTIVKTEEDSRQEVVPPTLQDCEFGFEVP